MEKSNPIQALQCRGVYATAKVRLNSHRKQDEVG